MAESKWTTLCKNDHFFVLTDYFCIFVQLFINTLNKLTDQNLGDREPHPFIEWFFYSHPSIKNRINAIRDFVSEKNIVEQTNIKNLSHSPEGA